LLNYNDETHALGFTFKSGNWHFKCACACVSSL